MWRRLLQSPDWRFFALQLVLVASLQIIGPEYFRYERDWAGQGEIWRIVTAHWVHVGWSHLLLNMLGLFICISLARPHWSLRRWFSLSLIMALGISILFTLQNPELGWYVGFSGILFGLYFLTAHDLYARDRLIASLILAALIIKVVLEQYTPFDFDSSTIIGVPVVVDAHLYGLLMAIAIALIWSTYTMNHGSTEHSN